MGFVTIFAFIVILAALAAAGYFMLTTSAIDKSDGDGAEVDAGLAAQQRQRRMARALTVRIAMSVLLFIAILLAWYLGYIKPSGLPLQTLHK